MHCHKQPVDIKVNIKVIMSEKNKPNTSALYCKCIVHYEKLEMRMAVLTITYVFQQLFILIVQVIDMLKSIDGLPVFV